ILQWYFSGVGFRVEEFVPREVAIDDSERWRLGFGGLGDDLVLGDRIGDSAGRIRLWCGPLDRDAFARFLPDGADFPIVAALARLLLRSPLEVVLVLTLRPEAMAAAELGADAFHLGHNTWLGLPDPDRTPWPSFFLPGT
ncbi:MAG: type VI secretion system baseplate subunit TssG, partial [Geminicoccales bacterium]